MRSSVPVHRSCSNTAEHLRPDSSVVVVVVESPVGRLVCWGQHSLVLGLRWYSSTVECHRLGSPVVASGVDESQVEKLVDPERYSSGLGLRWYNSTGVPHRTGSLVAMLEVVWSLEGK